jgi:hypothetical protein
MCEFLYLETSKNKMKIVHHKFLLFKKLMDFSKK